MRTVKDTASCQHLFYVALAAAYPQSTSDKRRTRWWFKKKENLLFELHLTILKLPKRPLRRTHRIPHWPIARLDHNIHSTAAHSAAVNLPSAMSLLISKTLDSIPPFKHTPLDHTQPSIRIMKVLPDLSPEGSVQCTLTHGTTDDDYTCLSYTWGDENTTCPALMNGQLFFVRQNLHNFMHVVRRLYPLRPFWIDAVCIDQGTVAERNHQVAQMGAIYTAAAHVLVWLGSSSNIADFFRAWNQRCKSKNQVSSSISAEGELRKVEAEWVENGLVERGSIEAGWVQLAKHAYWTRAWITQEVAHSRSLSLLADIVEIFDLQGIAPHPWFAITNADVIFPVQINIAQQHRTRPGDSLSSLLRRLPYQECQTPRDRVYSLLGLAEEGTQIMVDYGSSDLEFILMLFTACRDLACLCGLGLLSNVLGNLEEMDVRAVTEAQFVTLRLRTPSTFIIPHEKSWLDFDRSKTDCPWSKQVNRMFVFKMNRICGHEPGNIVFEVVDFGYKKMRQQVCRIARLMCPSQVSSNSGEGIFPFDGCACRHGSGWWQQPSGSSEGRMHYDHDRKTWQPHIGARHHAELCWSFQPGSGKIVSDWFCVQLQWQAKLKDPIKRDWFHKRRPVRLEIPDEFTLALPISVLFSYTQQSRAFEDLEAHFRSESRPRRSSILGGGHLDLCGRARFQHGAFGTIWQSPCHTHSIRKCFRT